MALAFVVSVAFESPMMGLEKLVFPKNKKKQPSSDKKGIFETAKGFIPTINKGRNMNMYIFI